jgi:PAS domain S-box-containing protein
MISLSPKKDDYLIMKMERQLSNIRQKFPRGGLYLSLLGAIVLFTFLPQIILGFVFREQVSDQITEQVVAKIRAISALQAHEIMCYFEEMDVALANVLRTSDSRNHVLYLLGNSASADDYFLAQQDINELFYSVLNQDEGIAELFLLDSSGRLVLSTDQEHRGNHHADMPFFQVGFQERFMSDLLLSPESGETEIYISEPVLDQSESVPQGVLVMRLNGQSLAEIFANMQNLGETGEAYLVLPSGQIITPLQHAATTSSNFQTYGIQEVLAGKDGFGLYSNYAGAEVIGYYRWLPQLGVGLLVEQTTSEAFVDLERTTNWALVTRFLTAIISVVAILAISKGISKPIINLTRAAEAIGAGNLEIKIPDNAGGEIRRLAEVIQNMHKQVAERTWALETSAEVGRLLSHVRESRDLLTNAVELIRERFELYYVQIYLTDPGEEILVLRAGSGDVGQHLLEQGHQLDFSSTSINGTVAVEGQTLVVENTRKSEIHKPNEMLPETCAEMAVPLIFDRQVVGVLNIQSNRLGLLNKASMPAFEVLAGQLAISIINSDLYTNLERRVAERTHELREAQLASLSMMEDAERARKKAEEINQQLRSSQIATMNIMMDVEEARKNAQQNEARFRSLFDESPIALLEEDFSQVKKYLDDLVEKGVDDLEVYFQENLEELRQCTQDIKVTAVNQEAAKLFCAQDQNHLGQNLPLVFTGESLDVFGTELTAFFDGDLSFECEVSHRNLDGVLIWTMLKVIIAPGFEDSWGKVLVSIMDISAQKEVQLALLAEKEFSDQVINSIPGIFYIINAQGKFSRWNDNFETITEFSAGEISSMPPPDLFEGVERDYIASRIAEVFDIGESNAEASLLSKSGKKTHFYFTGYRLDIKGEPVLIGTGFDISERKYWEEQLALKAQELTRSNEELERFAYVASHDLQEPLRMVASYLQLLERRYDEQLDSAAKEFITFAVDGAARMKTLINDLLAYSRVNTKGQPFEQTNFNDVIQRVLMNLQPSITENQAKITSDDLPVIAADETQISQVFQNLIANAIKFRDERPPKIHIGIENFDAHWQFSVRDNGIGIEPEFFERIFVIFQRLHTRNEYSGTGIGLAISQRIVERHGGRIWIESKPGEGSTFFFTLPKRPLCETQEQVDTGSFQRRDLAGGNL